MTRIGLQDTGQDALVKMSDGNPGALTVMIGLVKRDKEGLIDILTLDTLGLYGSDIWLAYKDVCGEDIEKLVDRLRSNDLTLVSDVASARGLLA